MGEPEKEAELKKAALPPEDGFFAGPQGAAASGSFGDSPSVQVQQSSAESLNNDEASELKTEAAEKSPAVEAVKAAENRPVLPPSVQNSLLQYLEISKKLLFSPMTFFKEMEREGGLVQPGIFLGVSAAGYGTLSAVLNGFNLLAIPRNCLFVGISCFIVSGLAYMMSKSMGSKCSFEACFRVFAYCSCLSVLGAIPGVNFLSPIAGLVLNFFGLKEVLGVSVYQTCTIMFLVAFMQTLLTLGQMLGH